MSSTGAIPKGGVRPKVSAEVLGEIHADNITVQCLELFAFCHFFSFFFSFHEVCFKHDIPNG